MTKLKPCPFCGGESLLRDRYINGVANTKHYIRECRHCKATFANWYRSIKKANEAWNRRADDVPVVRCVECIWWQDRQVQLIDGSCRDYMPDEPWSVTCDVGINVGSHCTKRGFDDESGSWFWAAANDYCSYGEKMEVEP